MRSDFVQSIRELVGEQAKKSVASQAKRNAKRQAKQARNRAQTQALRKAAFEQSPAGQLVRLERAFEAAPVGSVAKAQAGQLLTMHRLRKAAGGGDIPPDQTDLIRQAIADAEGAATASGKPKVSAKDQLAAVRDGRRSQSMSLAARDPRAVAHNTSPGNPEGVIKQLEADFVRARANGSEYEIARTGEELTRARLRLAHGGIA
ncbi:MAG: hypothetical protein ACTHMY_18080 [Solirubrobacteraceae bacterium]